VLGLVASLKRFVGIDRDWPPFGRPFPPYGGEASSTALVASLPREAMPEAALGSLEQVTGIARRRAILVGKASIEGPRSRCSPDRASMALSKLRLVPWNRSPGLPEDGLSRWGRHRSKVRAHGVRRIVRPWPCPSFAWSHGTGHRDCPKTGYPVGEGIDRRSALTVFAGSFVHGLVQASLGPAHGRTIRPAGRIFDRRRGRDSNPRCPCGQSGFQDRRIRPLCHLSG